MLFSILIPVYNVEKYLRECIDSVLNQNEKDIEIILCDDGSTDNSGNICDEYKEKYPNIIKVIHKENEGLLLTRRKLFSYAKGQYVLCIDGDDYISDNALNKLKEIILKSSPDIILYNLECRGLNVSSKIFNLDLKKNYLYTEKINIYKQILINHNINSLCTKVIKRNIIDTNEDYSKYSILNMGEDLFQTLPIFDKAESIYYYDKVLYYYIKNNDSITYTLPNNILEQRKILWKSEDFYFNKWNFSSDEINKNNIKRFKSLIGSGLSLYNKSIRESNKNIFQSYIDTFINDDYFIDLLIKIDYKRLNIKYKLYYNLLKNKSKIILRFLYKLENFILKRVSK